MKRNRILIYIFSTFLLLGLVLFFFATPIIINAAKLQLQNTFPASAVSIEKCHFNPKSSLTFSNINIKRENAYNFTIKEVSINYKILQIFKGSIDNVRIDDPFLNVNLRKSTAVKLAEMINISGPGIFRIREVDLSGARIKLATKDLTLDGRFSLGFSPGEKKARHIDAVFDKLEIRDVLFEEVRIKENPSQDIAADFSVKRIAYNKAVIKDLTGVVRSVGGVLSLDSLKAQLFNGDVLGDIAVALDKNREFSIDLNFSKLDLETLVKDFDLDGKLQLTGRLSGNISVSGRNLDIDDIRGTFKTASEGGLLVIKDTGFLEKLDSQAGQPAGMAAESLKNYAYTVGIVNVSLEEGNIVLGIEMEGDAGKRTFDIVVHDMVLIKKGAL